MSANTILTSIVTGGANNHTTTAEEANAFPTDFVSAGVVGAITANTGSGGTGSFTVNQDTSPDMGITIKAGQAYISAIPSSQGTQVLRARAAADYTAYTINANASGSTKYDWIYLKVDPTNANVPSAAADNVTSIYTSRSSSNSVDNGTPPTYGLVLGVVTVANGASSITNGNIIDKRVSASVSANTSGTSSTFSPLSTTITAVTANGNRSYSLTSSADVSAILSPGMRLMTTRTVVAPTQCTSLNGTTQYYSKTSPSGMTFTNNFVVAVAAKPSAYQQGMLASRYNGTSGWYMQQLSTGQVEFTAFNAGASNFFKLTSYQSVALNKWANNIVGQMDMTVTTNTPTTNYMMLDGADIPCVATRGGTNPTALVQAGNLEIGSYNGGSLPYAGKIAQVAIFNAKVTQATMRGYISQGLAGTETSLISAYSFNNAITDLNTTNANNLTANGSAVATNADSPFGGQANGTISSTLDYGIVQTVSASTIVVQVAEGCTIPTSGGVSAVSYSSVKSPFGFPAQKDKWVVQLISKIDWVQNSPVQNTWYSTSNQLMLPIGIWDIMWANHTVIGGGSGGLCDCFTTLSTSLSSEVENLFTTRLLIISNVGIQSSLTKSYSQAVATATPYYLIARTTQASVTNISFGSTITPSIIFATNAYL